MGYKSKISKYGLIVSLLVWPTLIIALMYYNEVTIFSLTPSGYTLWAYLAIIMMCIMMSSAKQFAVTNDEKDNAHKELKKVD